MAKVNTDAVSLGVSRIRALREAAFWILAGLSLILLFALTSYRPDDPAFSVTGSSDAVLNLMGPWGAWFADISFHVVGLSAYLFPVLVLIAGLLIFREPKTALNRWNRFYRPAGFVLAVATSSGLATLHFTAPELRETAGGLLGQATGLGLESVLGHLGATVCLLVFWLSSVSLATGVSWMSVMERVGRGTLAAYAGINVLLERVREQRDGKRAKIEHKQRIVRSRKKAAERAPRIEPTFERVETSSRTEREKQVPMFEAAGATEAAELPKLSLLDEPPAREGGYSAEELQGMSRLVEHKLADFGIEVEVVAVHPGPVVTRFELKPAPGVKVSQISNLAKDLARSLSTVSVRVVEVIPGKPFVGLEIPNEARELVVFAEIVRSEAFDENKSPLTLALGKGIGGRPIVADLLRMPHLLIAGTTGSGKSVALNAMVLSLLYKSTPEQVRLIMIDPKMLELSVYEGIPHLLAPVVTDMKEAANALRWCVAEMERRYQLMAGLGVRHISGYNRKVREAIESGKPLRVSDIAPGEDADDTAELTPLPFVVVIIDELADMMMMVGKKVEELIARLAQKARASGIHMIIATQRPSVDVITGLIKANIPCRIAFQVSAKVDSRTILDQMGAETLLGHGDMLYLPPGVSQPTRIHGAFVSDNEVHTVVQSLRASGEPQFVEGVLADPTEAIPGLPPGFDSELDSEKDALYDQAVRIVTETRKASISGIQRRLKIGYNRAARMVEAMEEAGIVGSLQSNGFREVLAPPPPADD